MASAHEMPSTNVTINLARFIVVPLLPVLRISDQRRRRGAAPATPAVQYVRPSGLGTSPLLGVCLERAGTLTIATTANFRGFRDGAVAARCSRAVHWITG